MIELNPVRMIVNVLTVARDKTVVQGGGGGGFGGGPVTRVPGRLRDVLDLKGAGGFKVTEMLVGLGRSLDYVEEATSGMSPRKAERFREACQQVRDRLDWEFRDPDDATQEPALNLDALIPEFEHLAIELDEIVDFPQVSEEEVDRWEATVVQLEASVRESDLDGDLRDLLLDAISALKFSIRDLRRFGSAACAERLRDALGRIVGADLASRGDDKASGLVRQAWTVFATITGYVEVIGKWKALPDLIKALDPRAK